MKMIELKPLTVDNFWDAIELKINREQEQYIPDNTFLIAMAKVLPHCIPLIIYDDNKNVGFLMYGLDENQNSYWIHIMMIDEKYQGKGYAKESFQKILSEIKKDKNVHKIVLAVNKGNINAVKMYENLGFKFNGQRFDENKWAVKIYQKLLNEEYIMELNY
jgi:diamine N-acetyltransferase